MLRQAAQTFRSAAIATAPHGDCARSTRIGSEWQRAAICSISDHVFPGGAGGRLAKEQPIPFTTYDAAAAGGHVDTSP